MYILLKYLANIFNLKYEIDLIYRDADIYRLRQVVCLANIYI